MNEIGVPFYPVPSLISLDLFFLPIESFHPSDVGGIKRGGRGHFCSARSSQLRVMGMTVRDACVLANRLETRSQREPCGFYSYATLSREKKKKRLFFCPCCAHLVLSETSGPPPGNSFHPPSLLLLHWPREHADCYRVEKSDSNR